MSTYEEGGECDSARCASLAGSAVILVSDVTLAMSLSSLRGLTVTSVSLVMKDEGPRVWTHCDDLVVFSVTDVLHGDGGTKPRPDPSAHFEKTESTCSEISEW